MPKSLKSTSILSALPALAVAAAFAGCGGADTVERAELEKQVRSQLSESVGQEAPKASCPDELAAEEGAKTRCAMEFPDGRLGISVKVTSVDGDKVNFDIQADDQLEPKS